METNQTTTVNGTTQYKVDTVIYGVHQLSETRFIVGGGGGNEINPNLIAILDLVDGAFRVAEKLALARDDVVWDMSVNEERKIICFTSTSKLFLLKFEDNNELKQKIVVELKTKDGDDSSKKYVRINKNGTKAVLCDDFNNIQVYEITKDYKMELKSTITNEEQKLNFNDVQIIEHDGSLLISATVLSMSSKNPEKRLVVWKYSEDGTHKVLLDEKSVPARDGHQFKKCGFSKTNQGVFLLSMCTGNRSQPTFVVKYKLNGDKFVYQSQTKVSSTACPVMCTSRGNEDQGFFGIGTPDNGLCVYSVDTLKKYSDVQKIHGLGLTVCDLLFVKSEDKLSACTGSIDKHIAIHDVSAKAPSAGINLFYIALLMILVALVFYYIKV